MRCPKCGFISFDHQEKCPKCKKDIKSMTDTLLGSVLSVAPPSFLRLNPVEVEDDGDEEFEFSEEEFLTEGEEIVDEDLEVLVGEEADEVETEISMADEAPSPSLDEEIKLGGADEEADGDEIEIDFSQFEDTAEDKKESFADEEIEIDEEGPVITLDMPDELTDISDLAPPPLQGEETVEDPDPAMEIDEDESLSLELDDLDFDLGLGDEDDSAAKEDKEAVLSLDDLDFTDALPASNSAPVKKSGSLDMDEDLNFDLDLGGLSIHKDV